MEEGEKERMSEELRAEAMSRTRMLPGDAALTRLSAVRVAVFGPGGVGGHAAGALLRSGVGHLRVVYSTEPPRKPIVEDVASEEASRRPAPGSVSFVPPLMGPILAGEAVKLLAGVVEA